MMDNSESVLRVCNEEENTEENDFLCIAWKVGMDVGDVTSAAVSLRR